MESPIPYEAFGQVIFWILDNLFFVALMTAGVIMAWQKLFRR